MDVNTPKAKNMSHNQELYKTIQNVLQKQFGLKNITLKSEVGFQNLNIRIISQNSYQSYGHKFIAKIYENLDCRQKRQLQIQNQFLSVLRLKRQKEIERGRNICKYPQVVASMKGEQLVYCQYKGSSLTMRLLTFIEGTIMSKSEVLNKNLIDSMIDQMLNMSQILNKIYHPEIIIKKLDFEIGNFLQNHYINRQKYLKPQILQIIENVVSILEPRIQELSKKVRKWLIHGDLNQMNLITNVDNQVIGIIDFSDIVQSYTMCELAIFIYYNICLIQSKAKKWEQIQQIIIKYASKSLLSEQQIRISYWLIFARGVNSIVCSEYYYALTPDNQYILKDQQPSLKVLQQFLTVNHQQFISNLISTIKQRKIDINTNLSINDQQQKSMIADFIKQQYKGISQQFIINKLNAYATDNYYIQTQKQKFILKVSYEITPQKYVNFQKIQKFLNMANQKDNTFNLIRLVKPQVSLKGSYTALLYNKYLRKNAFAYLYQYVEGINLSQYLLKAQINQLKQILDLTFQKLGTFHKLLMQQNQLQQIKCTDKSWCVQDVQQWSHNLQKIEDQKIRQICLHFIDYLKNNILPISADLTRSCIHHDITTDNIIINPLKNNPLLTLIDYDELSEGPLIDDLATLLIYATPLQDKNAFLCQLLNNIQSYQKSIQIDRIDFKCLYGFIGGRLAMSVCNMWIDHKNDPNNGHIKLEQQLRMLQLFYQITEQEFHEKVTVKIQI